MKETVFVEFMPEYNAYGIRDEVIESISSRGNIAEILLKETDINQLAPEQTATAQKPTVAFLMGREKGTYTIDYNYAKAIAQAGMNIKFLTYNEVPSQMTDVNGLILPGGAFDSPDIFYTDPLKKSDNKPGTRAYAYVMSIMQAEKLQMPMLGICAGAQIIGGMHGMRLYRNLKDYTGTPMEHKSKDLQAHEINVDANSELCQIMGGTHFTVNSRHREGSMNNDKISDLKIYASAPDGTPEAWGNSEKNILCIQWHPEDFAAQGDKAMQNIYNWMANKAHIYQKEICKQKSVSLADIYQTAPKNCR